MRSRTDWPSIKLVEEETQAFLDWAAAFLYPVDDLFAQAKILATRLGAHYRSNGLTEIVFWVPEVESNEKSSWLWPNTAHNHQIKTAKNIYLGVYTPIEPIDFRAREQVVSFYCDRPGVSSVTQMTITG
ncbi:MAG: glucosylglycerol hydrolase [Xenococcus sp. MO_188.B8]|nr:glucosylglycerol hydrolase [Xenococcus sp. MO_188.B8]